MSLHEWAHTKVTAHYVLCCLFSNNLYACVWVVIIVFVWFAFAWKYEGHISEEDFGSCHLVVRLIKYGSLSQRQSCSEADRGTNDLFVDMLSCVGKLTNRCGDHLEELVLPNGVKFVNLLVSWDTILCKVIDKVLGCFRVLFSLHPCWLCCSMSIFLWIFLPWLSLRIRLSGFWWENIRCREDLVKMLELLSCLQSILIWHKATVDLCDVGETVDNECSYENGTWNLIVFNR